MKSSIFGISSAVMLMASIATGNPGNKTNNNIMASPWPVTCAHELVGIDLPGHDVAPYAASYSDLCSSYCALPNLDCQAWTWSDFQGGTCWMKNGHGSGVLNDRVTSAVYYDCSTAINTHYVMIENCDIKGNDDFNRPGRSYGDCIGVADATFTWSDYNGGTCWYKKSYQRCEYAPNKHTGVLLH